ncbi:MAG TPA: hypothetical protein VNI52_12295 [Sphingobacteriaceae bacterium]|nr:hypothetical protein [Sphingobacteriaceae bacterium]
MELVLSILDAEKKKLEAELKNNNLMRINMQKARLNMSVIAEIKQVIKLINAKIKNRNYDLH